MSNTTRIEKTTVASVIEALLGLPDHVKRYSFKAVGNFAVRAEPTILMTIDDNDETVEIVSCKLQNS